MMKKLFLALIICLVSTNSFAAVELDADSNGAMDVNKGGTNSTTAANARTALGVPATATTLAGSCTVGPCLDGTSDGGDLIKLYGPGGFWTSLQAGNALANRNWRLPIAAPPAAGTTRLMNMDEDAQMGFVDPATFAAALGADDNYVTDAEKTVIGNTSGTNTGDQTSASALTITASGFDGNLAVTDDTVQEVAQKLDDLTVSGSPEVQDEAFSAANFNADTTHAVSQDDFYDKIHTFDADDDGDFTDETWFPSTSGAPTNATYLTTSNETGLSAEANLGALTTGILKIAVAAGVATPSTAVAGDFPMLNQNTSGTAAGLSGTPNITVGTISAGATGFSVDADGDTTVKSISTVFVDGSMYSELPINTAANPYVPGASAKLIKIFNNDGVPKLSISDSVYTMMTSNDVDDTPSDGNTTQPASSNSVADHISAADPHTGYVLESVLGTGVGTALAANANGTGGFVVVGNAAGASSVLTGYTSGAGTVAATDTILQAINKLNGNTAAKQDSDADLTTWAGVTPGTGVATALGSAVDTSGGVATNNTVKAKYLSGTEADFYGTLLDPQAIYAVDGTNHAVTLINNVPAAFTITEISVSCDADPTTETTLTFQHKAAGIGYSTPTTIEAVLTVNGAVTITSGIDDATIPAGTKVFMTLSDPDDALSECSWQIEGDWD